MNDITDDELRALEESLQGLNLDTTVPITVKELLSVTGRVRTQIVELAFERAKIAELRLALYRAEMRNKT